MKPPMTPTTIKREPTERRAMRSACRLIRGDNPEAFRPTFWLCATDRSKRTAH
jgi:hypothetical protein